MRNRLEFFSFFLIIKNQGKIRSYSCFQTFAAEIICFLSLSIQTEIHHYGISQSVFINTTNISSKIQIIIFLGPYQSFSMSAQAKTKSGKECSIPSSSTVISPFVPCIEINNDFFNLSYGTVKAIRNQEITNWEFCNSFFLINQSV